MTDNTESKKAKYPLPEQAEKQVAAMRGALPSPGTKLGLLARRLEASLRDLHQAANAYGQAAILRNVLGREHRIPISTRIDVVLTVCAEDAAGQTYQFALGDVPMQAAGRPEKSFDEFTVSTTVDSGPAIPTLDSVSAALAQAVQPSFGKTIEI